SDTAVATGRSGTIGGRAKARGTSAASAYSVAGNRLGGVGGAVSPPSRTEHWRDTAWIGRISCQSAVAGWQRGAAHRSVLPAPAVGRKYTADQVAEVAHHDGTAAGSPVRLYRGHF